METPRMTSISDLYRAYIACLNDQRWDELGTYVASDVQHNGRSLGLSGYRDMLINDFEQIPDLFFKIGILTCEPPFVAARLEFDCSPKCAFLGLPVNGRKVRFAENVFYQFRDGQIVSVWSVIDKTAIEAQLNL
jgi:predicted ester cyclase